MPNSPLPTSTDHFASKLHSQANSVAEEIAQWLPFAGALDQWRDARDCDAFLMGLAFSDSAGFWEWRASKSGEKRPRSERGARSARATRKKIDADFPGPRELFRSTDLFAPIGIEHKSPWQLQASLSTRGKTSVCPSNLKTKITLQ